MKSAVKEIRARMGPIAGIVFAQGIGRTEMPDKSERMAESKPDRGQSLVFSSASLRQRICRNARATSWRSVRWEVVSDAASAGWQGSSHKRRCRRPDQDRRHRMAGSLFQSHRLSKIPTPEFPRAVPSSTNCCRTTKRRRLAILRRSAMFSTRRSTPLPSLACAADTMADRAGLGRLRHGWRAGDHCGSFAGDSSAGHDDPYRGTGLGTWCRTCVEPRGWNRRRTAKKNHRAGDRRVDEP